MTKFLEVLGIKCFYQTHDMEQQEKVNVILFY